ncbi:MFS transporter [Streptomyces sp. NPDC049585]|uniref:MFS transporter n=1 Tax=Streptomyces sp. NPDC049585 TaxID=3155154 RepID=UPI00341B0D34
MLVSSLGTSVANVALPTLAGVFAAPFRDVQWVVLAYLLAVTTLVVGAGRLGDLIGRRRLLLAGIGVFTAASAVCGAAPALWVLVLARAAQGAGAAVMMALTMAFVGETVPRERTGGAMGLLGTMSAVGTAAGPSLGGLLISGFGWRAVFWAQVPLGVAAVLIARRHLPAGGGKSGAEGRRPRFDLAGTLLLAVTLGAYALAMTTGRMVLLVVAGCGAVVFVVVERRAASPLVRPATFRDPLLSASLATSALVSTVMMTTLVVGPFHLARGLGLDAARVGLAVAVGPLVAALTGVPAGRIVDRLGAWRVTVAGLAATASGAFALSVLPVSLGVVGYLAPLVVMTAGYALFQTANNTAVMADAGPEQRGVVSGVLNLSRNLGLVTGTSVMGAVFALASSASDVATAPAGAVATGMHVTFAVAAVLVVLALGIALGAGAWARRGARVQAVAGAPRG